MNMIDRAINSFLSGNLQSNEHNSNELNAALIIFYFQSQMSANYKQYKQ